MTGDQEAVIAAVVVDQLGVADRAQQFPAAAGVRARPPTSL